MYNWQKDYWTYLQGLRARMPHALLLQGRAGIGKLELAQNLASALLCESPMSDGQACNTCTACLWLAQGSHPDFRRLEPEALTESSGSDDKASGKKASSRISVAQVRELSDFVNLSTHRHGLRIILIHPAESMNPQAANALLKTLEEPPPSTLFILVSHHPQQLLPTIRSRCHKIEMNLPPFDASLAWLKQQGVSEADVCLALAGRAPLRALALSAPEFQTQRKAFLDEIRQIRQLDAISIAERYAKTDLGDVLDWLQKWVHDLLCASQGAPIQYQLDYASNLRELAKKVNLKRLLDYQRELLAVRRILHHPLNAQLLLEQLLLNYSNIVIKESAHG